jgi:hypothetical protein
MFVSSSLFLSPAHEKRRPFRLEEPPEQTRGFVFSAGLTDGSLPPPRPITPKRNAQRAKKACCAAHGHGLGGHKTGSNMILNLMITHLVVPAFPSVFDILS